MRTLAFLIIVVLPLSACAESDFTGSGSAENGESRKLHAAEPRDDRSEDDAHGAKPGDEGKDDDKSGTNGDDTDQNVSLGEDDDQTDGELSEEDEDLIAALPGVEVVKVGVNFEDRPVRAKDIDYNDAVLCFEGKFKVEGSNVVSIAKQKVTATTFSNAGCSHLIKVEIIDKKGKKKDPISYDSKAMTPIEMEFKVGSKLEVTMTVVSGSCTGGTMHDAVHARVAPNLCNNR